MLNYKIALKWWESNEREETDKIKWTVALCGTLLLFLYGLFTQNIIINLLVIFRTSDL